MLMLMLMLTLMILCVCSHYLSNPSKPFNKPKLKRKLNQSHHHHLLPSLQVPNSKRL